MENTCAYSGKKIISKKDIVYSPYSPSFFLAKNPQSFFSALLEASKNTIKFKIYFYNVKGYQILCGKYFDTLRKTFGSTALLYKGISKNKKFMKFATNPKVSLLVLSLINLVVLSLIFLAVKISDLSKITFQFNAISVIMTLAIGLFLLCLLFLNVYYIVIYFRFVRPLENALK